MEESASSGRSGACATSGSAWERGAALTSTLRATRDAVAGQRGEQTGSRMAGGRMAFASGALRCCSRLVRSGFGTGTSRESWRE
jgi:hypothetical protein